MDGHDDRSAELMGGALGGDLNPAELAELRALVAADPDTAAELAELEAVRDAARAQAPLVWDDAAPSAALRDRVLAATASATVLPNALPTGLPTGLPEALPTVGAGPATATSGTVHRLRPRRRPVLQLLVAATLLAVGGLGGWSVAGVQDDPPTGPPGTLGAYEALTFDERPADIVVAASLVAHTWGTETVLDVSGLPAGETFTVVLSTRDGDEVAAGSFEAVDGPVTCRMTAATMRSDVAAVTVVDTQGRTVMTTQVADVASAAPIG